MNNNKQFHLRVRYNEADLRTIDKRRKEMNMTRSNYIRTSSLDRLPKLIPAINKEAWIELSKLAANLNQHQKAINRIHFPIQLKEAILFLEEKVNQGKITERFVINLSKVLDDLKICVGQYEKIMHENKIPAISQEQIKSLSKQIVLLRKSLISKV